MIFGKTVITLMDIDQTLVDSSSIKDLRDRAYSAWRNGEEDSVDNKYFKEAINHIKNGEIKPFVGMIQMLKSLPKYKKVIFVSSSPESYCKTLLEKIGLSEYDCFCYEEKKDESDPDPEPYIHAVEKYYKKREKLTEDVFVIVGDELEDIIGAERFKSSINKSNIVFSVRACWGTRLNSLDEESRVIDLNNDIHQGKTNKIDEDYDQFGRPNLIFTKIKDLNDFIILYSDYKWQKHELEDFKADDLNNITVKGLYTFTDYFGVNKKDDENGAIINARYHDQNTTIFDDFFRNNRINYATSIIFDKSINSLKTFLEIDILREEQVAPHSIGIFPIPSSQQGEWDNTMQKKIIPNILTLDEDIEYVKCSETIYRKQSLEIKNTAVDDINVELEPDDIEIDSSKIPDDLSIGVIIGDITTNGNSFKAVLQKINEEISKNPDNKLPRTYYCLALGRVVDINNVNITPASKEI